MSGIFYHSAYAAEPDFEDPAAVEILIREMEASGDPYAAYAELSSEGKAAVNEYLSVATTETTGTFEPHSSDTYADSASSGCRTNSYSVRVKNLVGYTLWKFTRRTEWCWDGSVITSDPFLTTDGDVYYPFWSYEGVRDKWESGGEGDWMHRGQAEGYFKYCIGPWNLGCLQHVYPDIGKRQYGDGQSQSWGGQ